MESKKSANRTAIDLFGGCGGTIYGLKQAGFNVLGTIELDNKSSATCKKNNPEIKVLASDIRKIKPNDFFKYLNIKNNKIDLISACPPCQGFSSLKTLNKSKDTNDERNSLILEILKFVKFFTPNAILVENVPGLKNSDYFFKICHNLESLDYKVSYFILDASNYGVPQRRKRLIAIWIKNHQIEIPIPLRKISTVRDTIGNLPKPGKSGVPLHDLKRNHSKQVMERICLIPKDGGSRSDLPYDFQLRCHQRNDGFKDVYGRMKWDDVSPTLTRYCTNPSKGRFLHPNQNRAITLYEASLLQSFPKNYHWLLQFGASSIASMIGEAFPPNFSKEIGLHIYKILNKLRF